MEVTLHNISLGFIILFLTTTCRAHVSLTFPPARKYALDFLDNARTNPPCGQTRGNGPVTDLASGKNMTVTWYLGYAHDGGYRIELLTYDTKGQANVIFTLTGRDGLFIGDYDKTASSANITLPVGFICTNCTIRLVRQALNWGRNYLFWSCADINVVQANLFVSRCSGHGHFNDSTTGCTCDATYSGDDCQNKDECYRDGDCGMHGQCRRITEYSFPQKQCFCLQGWFGLKCDQASPLTSAEFNPADYMNRMLSDTSELVLYYRIFYDLKEVEIVVRGRTQSYIGIGWKRRNSICQSSFSSVHQQGSSEPNPEQGIQVFPEPISESEPLPTNKVVQPETESPRAEPEPTSNLSPVDQNGMDCTDMVIGSVIGKMARIRDYYSPDRSTPKLDDFYGGRQSLTAAVGEETSHGITTIIFRKPLKATEDTDLDILNEEMIVIWSHGQKYNDTPSIGDFYRPDELKYHAQHRGIAAINFFRPASMSDRKTIDQSISEFSYPNLCSTETCTYKASWDYNKNTDAILFTIRAKQQQGMWTGLGFAKNKIMEDIDVVYGYINSANRPILIDGWVSSLYSPPSKDSIQNLINASAFSDNGFLTLNFSRSRTSLDPNDYGFSDISSCYYFMFPVGGGASTDDVGGIGKHFQTPIVSFSKICIDSSSAGKGHNNSVAERLPEQNGWRIVFAGTILMITHLMKNL